MRGKLFPLFSVSLALSLPLPVLALGPMGNGDPKSELRRTASFSSIDMSGVGRLRLERGPTTRVEVRLDSNLLPRYRTEVRGGVLHLGFEPGFVVGRVTELEVRVTMADLESVSLSGAAEAELGPGFSGDALSLGLSGAASIAGRVDYDSIEAELSGSGNAELSGRAGRLRVGLSGAGVWNGRDLACREARVRVSGAGRVLLRVEKELDVQVSGAASVSYWGDPRVDSRISGSGRVSRSGGF